MGERRWRAAREAGFTAIPAIVRETGDDVDAPRRAAGEPAPRPAQPAGGGRGLRPAAAGLRLHPRRAGRPDRPVPAADLQHPPAAEAAAARAAPGRGRGALGRARPRPARAGRRRRPRSGWPQRIVAEGLSVRPSRRSSPSAATPPEPAADAARPRGRWPPSWPSWPTGSSDRFETRVKVDLGRSKGRIVVEFASIDDLERIVALMAPDAEIRRTSTRPDRLHAGATRVRLGTACGCTRLRRGDTDSVMSTRSTCRLVDDASTCRLAGRLRCDASRHVDMVGTCRACRRQMPRRTSGPSAGRPAGGSLASADRPGRRRVGGAGVATVRQPHAGQPRRPAAAAAGAACSGSSTRSAARGGRGAGDVELEKEAWVSATLLEWGSCGKIVYVDSSPAGYLIYAPPVYVPRSLAFPTSPVSADAVLLMTGATCCRSSPAAGSAGCWCRPPPRT